MKALMLEGKRKLTLLDVEDPVASANSQLISIKATSIGGSEYLGLNNPGRSGSGRSGSGVDRGRSKIFTEAVEKYLSMAFQPAILSR